MAAWWATCAFAVLALMPAFAHGQSRGELLGRLVRAYPDALSGHDDKSITWRDGTVMSWRLSHLPSRPPGKPEHV